jgi:fatty-acyl-CoA synthase
VPGTGAVLHTLNPRLHPDQVAWIAGHAADRVLFFDLTFLALVETIVPRLPGVKALVAMTDRAHMPRSCRLPHLLCYEDLLEAHDDRYEWPAFDETTASSLCYTSGTTGEPKGVLYSHRSTVLHCYAVALPDSLGLGAREVILPVVPMFHVNAWGQPHAACMVGAKVVFPGPAMDGRSLHTLLEVEQVTIASGVPTVWQGLLAYMEENSLGFAFLKRAIIGGSACPPAMLSALEERHGVSVIHGWGMTETGPVGTVSLPKGASALTAKQRLEVKTKQGRCLFGIDMKVVDDTGAELPWNARSGGHLMVRGAWVLERYFRAGESALVDGWFHTGDIATIDPHGFMQITDRTKDVIKSGGEWISSIDLESVAMAHPAVAMAACIGVPHPKWDERPLLVVLRKPGAHLTRDELIAFYSGKVAKWWTPEDVVFVERMPLGATGKMLKTALREQFRAYRLPTI